MNACTELVVYVAFGIPSNFTEGSSPIHHNSTPEQLDGGERDAVTQALRGPDC